MHMILPQPPKQLHDVVWKCLDIIIMQSSQTPQPNKLVCVSTVWVFCEKDAIVDASNAVSGKMC